MLFLLLKDMLSLTLVSADWSVDDAKILVVTFIAHTGSDTHALTIYSPGWSRAGAKMSAVTFIAHRFDT